MACSICKGDGYIYGQGDVHPCPKGCPEQRTQKMSVTIQHRFGGHRGRSTEWEITTSDAWAHDNFPRLKKNPAVWNFCKGARGFKEDYHSVSLTLDEGNPEFLAMEMVSAIINEDFDRLQAAILRTKVSEHNRPGRYSDDGEYLGA